MRAVDSWSALLQDAQMGKCSSDFRCVTLPTWQFRLKPCKGFGHVVNALRIWHFVATGCRHQKVKILAAMGQWDCTAQQFDGLVV